jgi:ATP-dependent DNA ligase
VPEIRGAPSARSVAIVLCRCASNGVAFDLLHDADSGDLRDLPRRQRGGRLETLLAGAPTALQVAGVGERRRHGDAVGGPVTMTAATAPTA